MLVYAHESYTPNISVKHMSIRWRHQLIYNYYHSNGFCVIYLCKEQARQSFRSISQTFPVIFIFLSFFLSFFFFFFISENQSGAGNVIQLIKNK